MIVEAFASLPPYLDIEGVNFELQLIVNGRPDDVRLVYALSYASNDSPHFVEVDLHGSWKNPYNGGALQGFLFLIENIETDQDLLGAIQECKEFLKTMAIDY